MAWIWRECPEGQRGETGGLRILKGSQNRMSVAEIATVEMGCRWEIIEEKEP